MSKRKTDKGGDGSSIALAAPTGQSPAPVTDIIEVEIKDLKFDSHDDRLEELLDEQRIKDLAASMREVGLLHPIGVTPSDGGFLVNFGRRRVMAAQSLGWTRIAAITRMWGEEQVLAARQVENIQRENWNPVEESMSVVRLLDLEVVGTAVISTEWKGTSPPKTFGEASPPVRGRAVADVATRLGKSEQWVRDRAFLARLDGKARRAVIEGRLPMGHAREISRLADPALRDDLASRAAANPKACRNPWPMPLDELKLIVSQNLLSLKQVPWRLDVAFAGKPACFECPHNSSNQPGLFDGGGTFSPDLVQARTKYGSRGIAEPVAGVCSMAACYRHKAGNAGQAARSAAARLVTAAAKEHKGKAAKKFTPSQAAALIELPKHLSASTVARLAMERAAKKPKKAAAASTAPTKLETANEARREAEWKWKDACTAWVARIEPAIAAALAKKPGAWAILKLLSESKPWEATQAYDRKKAAAAAGSSNLRSLINRLAEPGWPAIVAIEKECGKRYGLFDRRDGHSGLVVLVAEALGVELAAPMPVFEDFLPKELRPEKESGKSGKSLKASGSSTPAAGSTGGGTAGSAAPKKRSPKAVVARKPGTRSDPDPSIQDEDDE